MNLDEFVTTSLNQIVQGVAAAGKDSNGKVAPPIGFGDDDLRMLRSVNNCGVFLVEFDVVVSATDKTEKTGGGGLEVWSVASAKASISHKGAEASQVNRIKFSVPISY